jgi:glycosyl transferase family 25
MKTKDLSQLAIDTVLCISLNSREDRRNMLSESFRDSGLKIDFFLVDKDTDNPERGCYNSHRAVAKKILEHDWRRALVLEDDCILEPFSPTLVSHINRFLRNHDPEIFYLGVLLGKCWLTWNTGVARCRGQGTHAYIVSARGCQKILAWENYAGKGIDNLFSKRFKGYCAFPMIAFQNEASGSDIQVKRAKRTGESKDINPRAHLIKKQYSSALKNWYKLCWDNNHDQNF